MLSNVCMPYSAPPPAKTADHLFPNADAMAAWDALTPAEQLSEVARAEEEGFRSGAAAAETLAQRLARVRRES